MHPSNVDGITHTDALIGLMLSAAGLWGAVFGFAYSRRQFGEPARSYLIGFGIAWSGTFFSSLSWRCGRPASERSATPLHQRQTIELYAGSSPA